MDRKITKLTRENKILREIIDKVSDGVYATDKKGTILFYNTAFAKMEGTNKAEMVGRKDMEIYPISLEYFHRLEILKNHQPLLDCYMSYYTYSGKKVNIVYNTYPYIEDGEIEGIFSISRDLPSTNELIKNLAHHFNQQQAVIKQNGTRYCLADILGVSKNIKQAIEQAKRIARLKSTVTIIGETGSGKELFAQGIHNISKYSGEPFISVNCAAIPETLMDSLMMGTVKGAFSGALDTPGFFEQAGKGTLLLDEINSLSLNLQPKLLRLLEERTVRRIGDKKEREISCRVIFATNENLFASAQQNKFREDLLYRMTPLILDIPPLRDRMEDFPILTEKFISDFNQEVGLTIQGINDELMDFLMCYKWPGNVRELQNVIESSMSLADLSDNLLTMDHLPVILRQRIKKALPQEQPSRELTLQNNSLDNMLSQYEKNLIEQCLRKSQGNVSESAAQLGIDRQGLHYRIRKLKIKSDYFRKK